MSFITLLFCVRSPTSTQRFWPVGLLGRCPVRTSPGRRNSLTGIFFDFCTTPRKFRVKLPIVSLTACYQFIGPNHPKIRRCVIQPPTMPLNKPHLYEHLVDYARKCALNWLNFRQRASSIEDRRFATLQRTLFIYLINKYISLSDTCLTVHHWYKWYRKPTRFNNNGLLIIPVSSTCFGQLFCPSSGTLDCVLQFVV